MYTYVYTYTYIYRLKAKSFLSDKFNYLTNYQKFRGRDKLFHVIVTRENNSLLFLFPLYTEIVEDWIDTDRRSCSNFLGHLTFFLFLFSIDHYRKV